MKRESNRCFARLICAAGALALASTCAGAGDDWFDEDPWFEHRWRGDSITLEAGNAAAHNIAVHTIDPWPAHAKKSRIDIDGHRLLLGIQRYKANKSIPPKGLTTQSVIAPNFGTPGD
jgi:hypothetical protein